MAEPDAQPVATAARPPKGKGKRIAGLPLPVALGAAAALAALAYLWWRSRSSSSSSGTSSGADTTGTGSPDGATADDIATLQAEVEQLLAQAGGQGGTGGGLGSDGGGGGDGTGSGDGGTGTGSTGGGSAGGGPASGAKSAQPVRAPSGTRTADVTESEFVATWQATPAATSYRLQVTQAGRVIHDASTSSTAQKVTGLRPGSSYGWHVAAVNSHGQGPWSAVTGAHTSAAHKVGKVAGK